MSTPRFLSSKTGVLWLAAAVEPRADDAEVGQPTVVHACGRNGRRGLQRSHSQRLCGLRSCRRGDRHVQSERKANGDSDVRTHSHESFAPQYGYHAHGGWARRSFALQPVADVVSNSHRGHCVAVHHVHVRVHWRRPSHHRVRTSRGTIAARAGLGLAYAARVVRWQPNCSLMPVTEPT